MRFGAIPRMRIDKKGTPAYVREAYAGVFYFICIDEGTPFKDENFFSQLM